MHDADLMHTDPRLPWLLGSVHGDTRAAARRAVTLAALAEVEQHRARADSWNGPREDERMIGVGSAEEDDH